MRQLADNVALAEQTVLDGFDGAVSRRVGMEINGTVLGEINFAVLSLGREEFSGVIAARDGHGVEPQRAKPSDRLGGLPVREIPRIGINGLVAHAAPFIFGSLEDRFLSSGIFRPAPILRTPASHEYRVCRLRVACRSDWLRDWQS